MYDALFFLHQFKLAVYKFESGSYFDQLIDYDSQKRKLQLWIESLEALEKYIVAIGDSRYEKLLPPSFYIDPTDDYLKSALNELYTDQMERNTKLFNSTEENLFPLNKQRAQKDPNPLIFSSSVWKINCTT